jgi:hypothetical protein
LPTYRFSIQNVVETEELGIMDLRDDAEAVAFARRMVQDMADEDRRQNVGCSLDITEGQRAVGSISFVELWK